MRIFGISQDLTQNKFDDDVFAAKSYFDFERFDDANIAAKS